MGSEFLKTDTKVPIVGSRLGMLTLTFFILSWLIVLSILALYETEVRPEGAFRKQIENFAISSIVIPGVALIVEGILFADRKNIDQN